MAVGCYSLPGLIWLDWWAVGGLCASGASVPVGNLCQWGQLCLVGVLGQLDDSLPLRVGALLWLGFPVCWLGLGAAAQVANGEGLLRLWQSVPYIHMPEGAQQLAGCQRCLLCCLICRACASHTQCNASMGNLQVAAGMGHSLAVAHDGSVLSCGWNSEVRGLLSFSISEHVGNKSLMYFSGRRAALLSGLEAVLCWVWAAPVRRGVRLISNNLLPVRQDAKICTWSCLPQISHSLRAIWG